MYVNTCVHTIHRHDYFYMNSGECFLAFLTEAVFSCKWNIVTFFLGGALVWHLGTFLYWEWVSYKSCSELLCMVPVGLATLFLPTAVGLEGIVLKVEGIGVFFLRA